MLLHDKFLLAYMAYVPHKMRQLFFHQEAKWKKFKAQ